MQFNETLLGRLLLHSNKAILLICTVFISLCTNFIQWPITAITYANFATTKYRPQDNDFAVTSILQNSAGHRGRGIEGVGKLPLSRQKRSNFSRLHWAKVHNSQKRPPFKNNSYGIFHSRAIFVELI